MPRIDLGPNGSTLPVGYGPPRTSTPGPVDIPRWESEGGPDFTDLLMEYTAASVSGGDAPFAGLSLPGLAVGLPKADKWSEAYAPQDEYTSSNAADLLGKWKDSGGSKTGLGLAAYGWSGDSGGPGSKGSSPFGLQTAFWEALGKANAALKAAGLGTFGITEGWRSYAAQEAAKKNKPDLAATPGRSVHGIGLAADLRLTDAQYRWLKANGGRYGLVNLPGESWHWQYSPSWWNG